MKKAGKGATERRNTLTTYRCCLCQQETAKGKKEVSPGIMDLKSPIPVLYHP